MDTRPCRAEYDTVPGVDVSIVIVSYNGREHLRRCLTSIFERTQGVSFEVIVADNASSDGTPEMVVAEFPQVTLVRRSTTAGFASAATLPYRTTIERHRGMWRYYRSYLRPHGKIARLLVDSFVWTGIQSRCAFHLAASGLRRAVRIGKS